MLLALVSLLCAKACLGTEETEVELHRVRDQCGMTDRIIQSLISSGMSFSGGFKSRDCTMGKDCGQLFRLQSSGGSFKYSGTTNAGGTCMDMAGGNRTVETYINLKDLVVETDLQIELHDLFQERLQGYISSSNNKFVIVATTYRSNNRMYGCGLDLKMAQWVGGDITFTFIPTSSTNQIHFKLQALNMQMNILPYFFNIDQSLRDIECALQAACLN